MTPPNPADPGKPASAGRKPGSSGPRSKYAPRACQECRRRRAKCDGQKPTCARCQARGKSCVFTTEADNRGSAPKSYMSLLQARISLLEEVLRLHSIDVDASIAFLDVQRGQADGGPSAAYSSSQAFDQMCADLEGALYLDDPLDENEAPGSEARFFGATSGRLELQPLTSSDIGTPSDTERAENSVSDRQIHKAAPGSREVYDGGVDDLVTPDLRDSLVDLYFQWEQPWFQMVDKRLFKDSLHRGGPYSSTLLLCCIMAVGSRYSDEPTARTDPDDPRTAGRLFAERAEVLLGNELRSPSIPTLQALAILGTYQIAIGSDSLAWQYHGMANRLLLDLGLNVHSNAVTGISVLTPDEVHLRRQIYWALYCNDKLWASYSGRDSQAAVPLPSLPSAEDMPGHDRNHHLVILQHAMATHCQILEKILTRLYGPKRPTSASERRAFFDSCILALKGWYYSLPLELKTKLAEGETGLSPHALVLAMVYHTSVVLLSKPFLPRDHRSKGQLGAHEVSSRASAASLEAAGEICILTERYREAFGGFRCSPITATHCTLTAALVIMYVPSGSAGRTPSRRSQVQCCLRTLRELTVSWGPPLRYWRTLDKVLSGKSSSGLWDSDFVAERHATQQSFRAKATNGVTTAAEANTSSDSGVPPPNVHDPQALLEHASFAAAFGDAADCAAALDVAMPFPQELWCEAAAQFFGGTECLDVGAFDDFSWDVGLETPNDGVLGAILPPAVFEPLRDADSGQVSKR